MGAGRYRWWDCSQLGLRSPSRLWWVCARLPRCVKGTCRVGQGTAGGDFLLLWVYCIRSIQSCGGVRESRCMSQSAGWALLPSFLLFQGGSLTYLSQRMQHGVVSGSFMGEGTRAGLRQHKDAWQTELTRFRAHRNLDRLQTCLQEALTLLRGGLSGT